MQKTKKLNTLSQLNMFHCVMNDTMISFMLVCLAHIQQGLGFLVALCSKVTPAVILGNQYGMLGTEPGSETCKALPAVTLQPLHYDSFFHLCAAT